MPALALNSSFLQFAVQKLQSSAPFHFQYSGVEGFYKVAGTRRLWRETEASTSRFVGFTSIKKRVLESVKMTAFAPEQAESVAQSDDVSVLSQIFEPVREGDKDLLLVFCPGALQASEKYFGLMQKIQSQLSLRLWVVVLHNTDRDSLTTSMIDISLTGVIARVKERGFRSGSIEIENVFIAGHSIGAWLARSVAVRRAQGFIQMGSCFDSKTDNLAQHPKPVLTLGGGLDGQMTPAAIAKHAGEVVATEKDLGHFNTFAMKPVIIIPGMNHAQFGDGRPDMERGDIQASITLSDAQQHVAEFVAAFLAVQSEGSHGAVGAHGLEILTRAVQETHARYGALWESLADQAGRAVSHQVHVASPSTLSAASITPILHDFCDNFVISKPWIDTEKSRVFITTYLSPAQKQGLSNMWVKMKSREALLRHFHPDGDMDGGLDPTAVAVMGKKINADTFEVALSLVADDAREMFFAKGKKLIFVDDWICPGPATVWIESDLSFSATKNGNVEVRTPVLMSPVEGITARFAGMHYMKVLTMARAIHWILVDSFR